MKNYKSGIGLLSGLSVAVMVIALAVVTVSVQQAQLTSAEAMGGGVNSLLANPKFEEDNFGTITRWNDNTVELNKWYLTNDPNNTYGIRRASWVRFKDIGEMRGGYGILAEDTAVCDFFCDTSVVQMVSAEPLAFYKLSAQGRLTEPGGGATLYLEFLNSSKGRIAVYTRGGFGTQWSTQTIMQSAPEGTAFVRVILYSSNQVVGSKLWDNVLLRKMDR